MKKNLVLLAAMLLAILSVVSFGTPAQAVVCGSAPSPWAHRGGDNYVENTGNAFLNTGANLGVKAFETDARITADGVWIIMHDPTVDDTLSGTGNVADLTYAQIAAMTTDDAQSVLTLREFVNIQSVLRSYALIELKVTPASEAQWNSFVSIIRSQEGRGGPKPAIISTSTAALDQVATRLPGYTRGLVYVGDADPADVLPHASLFLDHHDSITAARLKKWTDGGLKVYAWADKSADPKTEWDRMASYSTDSTSGSVSGYITSNVDEYLAWRQACTQTLRK